MPLTKPLTPSSSSADTPQPEVFHPDPELSEQISRMTERALTQVAVHGAVQSARSRVVALEREVAQLRAEAQWREAGFEEERAELRSGVHIAELETTEQRTRLEQAHLDVMELEDELSCVRAAMEVTQRSLTTLTAQAEATRERLLAVEAENLRLREQLMERERVLGAMWQTLKEYRAQGPIHRLLRRPELPEAQAPRLPGTVD
jgi:chromosome segregation ATPase